MPDPDKDAFHWELLKLLLQVAWADDDVHPAERRLIMGLSERFGLSPEKLGEVEHHLAGNSSLPPPNISLLRERREDVLEAASQLALADDEIHEAENEMLVLLHAWLDDPNKK